jgi:hypothetical protein
MISHAEAKLELVTKWAPIEGEWDFAGPTARVKGNGPDSQPSAHGVAVCDAKLRDGDVSVVVRFENVAGGSDHLEMGSRAASAGVVLGFSSEPRAYLVAGLGGFDFAFSIWEYVPANGWLLRAKTGQIQNLQYDRDYRLEVSQIGQRVSLTVDGVLVLDGLMPSPMVGAQLGLYSMSRCPVVFHDFKMARKRATAFVAMQFDESGRTIYREVIKPVADSVNLDVVRIDEIDRPGIILQEIQENIENASVVIAEITAPNQNVFYEVGYVHALHKPTILLAQRGRDLPFDIRSYRVIFYDDSIGGKSMIEKTLRNHLLSILREG